MPVPICGHQPLQPTECVNCFEAWRDSRLAHTIRVQTPACIVCGQTGVVTCNEHGYRSWVAGALIQEALRDLGSGEREQLITGTHPACWATMVWQDEEEA